MFLEITKANYLGDYMLHLWFNNGKQKIVNLKNQLELPVFRPLKDIDKFKKFSIKFNTIEWENGADIAPERLFEIGKDCNQEWK